MNKIVKLSDICDLQNGFAFKSNDYVEKSNTLNIRMSNIRPNGNFNEMHKARYLPDSFSEKYKEFLLKENDLIIAMTDMAGDPKILGLPTLVKNLNGRKFLLNQRVGKLHKFSKEIYVPYLCYFLRTLKEYYKNKGAGGLQMNISKNEILSANIYLKPIAEQKQTVAKLDATFAEIDKTITIRKSNKENIEKLKNSILNNFLNNNFLNTKIGDICELIYGKGLSKEKRVNENGIPAYGANGIKCYAAEPLYNGPSIIVGRKGSAGELQWVDNPFWALDVTYYVLPNEKKVNLKFLYYLLQMQNLPKLAKGVKPGLNRNEVYNINIKLPTIDEQIKITNKLEKIFKQQKILKELNDRINVNYHSLKSAIITKEMKHKSA